MIGRAEESLQALAETHSKWIDSLTDLIPAALYRDTMEHVDLRHMTREARAATKKAFKEQHKRAKREKLDPARAKSTSERLKQGERDEGEASGSDREEDGGKAPAPMALNFNDSKASKADLQERLRQRLEALSARRKGSEKPHRKGERAGGKDKAQAPPKDEKQKRVQEAKAWKEQQKTKRKAPEEAAAPQAKRPKGEAPLDLQFPVLDLEGPQLQRFTGEKARKEAMNRKQKGDKRTLLAKLEGGEGAGPADDRLQVALARARGERVLDDPKLLRKALKKEGKLKEKSAKAWQQRKEAEEEKKAAKQAKRRDNLKARKDKKIKTKIEKREKKLMRPGFEGRKDSFIN